MSEILVRSYVHYWMSFFLTPRIFLSPLIPVFRSVTPSERRWALTAPCSWTARPRSRPSRRPSRTPRFPSRSTTASRASTRSRSSQSCRTQICGSIPVPRYIKKTRPNRVSSTSNNSLLLRRLFSIPIPRPLVAPARLPPTPTTPPLRTRWCPKPWSEVSWTNLGSSSWLTSCRLP